MIEARILIEDEILPVRIKYAVTSLPQRHIWHFTLHFTRVKRHYTLHQYHSDVMCTDTTNLVDSSDHDELLRKRTKIEKLGRKILLS